MDKEVKSSKGGRETGATGRSRSEQEGHRERARLNKSLFLYHSFCSRMSPPAAAFVMSDNENHPS